jgi:hypothetical protein
MFRRKVKTVPQNRFVVHSTGDTTWKYVIYDTLRDVKVPKSESIYINLCQIDTNYLNQLEEEGCPVFPWEEQNV